MKTNSTLTRRSLQFTVLAAALCAAVPPVPVSYTHLTLPTNVP
jgi:hypothetical protein